MIKWKIILWILSHLKIEDFCFIFLSYSSTFAFALAVQICACGSDGVGQCHERHLLHTG